MRALSPLLALAAVGCVLLASAALGEELVAGLVSKADLAGVKSERELVDLVQRLGGVSELEMEEIMEHVTYESETVGEGDFFSGLLDELTSISPDQIQAILGDVGLGDGKLDLKSLASAIGRDDIKSLADSLGGGQLMDELMKGLDGDTMTDMLSNLAEGAQGLDLSSLRSVLNENTVNELMQTVGISKQQVDGMLAGFGLGGLDSLLSEDGIQKAASKAQEELSKDNAMANLIETFQRGLKAVDPKALAGLAGGMGLGDEISPQMIQQAMQMMGGGGAGGAGGQPNMQQMMRMMAGMQGLGGAADPGERLRMLQRQMSGGGMDPVQMQEMLSAMGSGDHKELFQQLGLGELDSDDPEKQEEYARIALSRMQQMMAMGGGGGMRQTMLPDGVLWAVILGVMLVMTLSVMKLVSLRAGRTSKKLKKAAKGKKRQ